MNFSIVVPGGCNGKCAFCFWKEQAASPYYLDELEHALSNLPVGLNLSITGGEPTLSPYFKPILKIIKKYKKQFEKVILTSNGANIKGYIKDMVGIVDHINISRHHYYSAIRSAIFGSDIAPDEYLSEAIDLLNKKGIDVTFNCVLEGSLSSREDILTFIAYSKVMGASSVCFRKDYGRDSSLSSNDLEKLFSDYKTTYEYDCPVCRTSVQLIKGMKVVWKASSYEPSIELNDIYELILQPSGVITIDWQGEVPIKFYRGRILGSFSLHMPNQRHQKSDTRAFVSNYSGCGIDTRVHSGCGSK